MALSTRRPVAILCERIPGTPADVAAALERLKISGQRKEINEVRLTDMVIVLGEVLNNIVEHALAGRDDGHVDLSVLRRSGRIEVETCDNGRPMPPALLSGAELPDIGEELDDMPEGGFGWFIIHSLVDDMIYERESGLNRLAFTFDLNVPTAAGEDGSVSDARMSGHQSSQAV